MKKNKIILNHVMTVVAVLILGYSSFALIIIRANVLSLWGAVRGVQVIAVAWVHHPVHGKARKWDVILAFR